MTTKNIQLHSLALAFILALGTVVVWMFVIGIFADSTINKWFPHKPSDELIIACDGTPVIKTYTVDDEGEAVAVYRGLDGRHVKFPQSLCEYQGSGSPREASLSLLASQFNPKDKFKELRWEQRLVGLAAPVKCPMLWYFIHDGKLEGHGYFVGYDKKTKLKIGYIGRNDGCVNQPALDEQFPVDGRRMTDRFNAFIARGYNTEGAPDMATLQTGPGSIIRGAFLPYAVYLLADDGLMRINVKERTVTLVRKDSQLISASTAFINSTTALPTATGESSARFKQAILLRSPDRVHALDMAGKEFQTWILPKELRDCELKWLQLSDDRVLVRPSYLNKNSRHYNAIDSNELYWITPDGKIARHEKVDLKGGSEKTSVGETVVMSLLFPCPALFAVGLWCDPSAAADMTIGSLLLAFISIVSLYGILFAFLCYRRQRRFGLPWTVAWVLFSLLFGLPGYIGYLAHRTWSARLACPHCGRRVPRDRPACIACGQEFPPPARKGIEVFA